MSGAGGQPYKVWRVRAHNTAADSENKIHDDRVAAAIGFRGGLVPGVTVYGYMIPAVVDDRGPEWLEHGAIAVRFVAPFYEGDTVVSRCHKGEARAEREDGAVCASGRVTLAAGEEAFPRYADHPLPPHEARPIASPATIVAGSPLGTSLEVMDAGDPIAVPERLLRMANEILVRNFRLNPWIHAGSEVRHYNLARSGETITVRGSIEECFERKGRHFAVAALSMSGSKERPVATVRHTFIFGLEIAA